MEKRGNIDTQGCRGFADESYHFLSQMYRAAEDNCGKLFQNVDFLKHLVYNIFWLDFYDEFVIEMVVCVCFTLSAL